MLQDSDCRDMLCMIQQVLIWLDLGIFVENLIVSRAMCLCFCPVVHSLNVFTCSVLDNDKLVHLYPYGKAKKQVEKQIVFFGLKKKT